MSQRQDLFFMKQALRLARRGRGKTSPNPMVGAVVVKRGIVVGKGYHSGPGLPHAEVLALSQAGRRSRGATLYTNLEPCCHTEKRTPPCTDAIVQSGIREVVAAMADPNPMVSGKGLSALRRAGVKVSEGLLCLEAAQLNEIFVKYITTRKPFVILKAAMTLDGRIATYKGKSRWITGVASRREVHRLREGVDAVMVGIGTVMADDPMLTVHRKGAINPLRVVIDPLLRTPFKARIVASLDEAETLLLTTSRAPIKKIQRLRALGVRISILSGREGIIPFKTILKALAERGVTSLLIEGGGNVNGIALRAGEVDRVIFYISPKLLCGEDAKGVVAGRSIPTLSDALMLDNLKVRRIGDDIRVEGSVKRKG